MSCGCTGSCGCDKGVSLSGFTNGEDAPIITNIAINNDNTLTFTFDNDTTITTDESITINSDAAILLKSLVAPVSITDNSSSFFNLNSYAVETDDYFTQNGDVLAFEAVLWHDSDRNIPKNPSFKIFVDGNNISEGIDLPNDAFAFEDGITTFWRGLVIKGEITRRTDTTVFVDFDVWGFGTSEEDIGGNANDLTHFTDTKTSYTGYQRITVSDLTTNDLAVLITASPGYGGTGADITVTLEKFNIKHYKLIT